MAKALNTGGKVQIFDGKIFIQAASPVLPESSKSLTSAKINRLQFVISDVLS
jgi:hypothetical protein